MAVHVAPRSHPSTYLLIFGLILVIFLAGFILWPRMSQLFVNDPSMLPKPFRSSVDAFLTQTVKSTYIPTQLAFIRQQQSEKEPGSVYIANWNKDGTHFSFLIGLTKDNKAINYQRIWTMPMVKEIDESIAETEIRTVFTEAFLGHFSSFPCTTTSIPEKKTLTECGSMKTDNQDNLLGVTVRTPVALTPPAGATPVPGMIPPEVTIVSACFVPKEGTPLYTAPLCI